MRESCIERYLVKRVEADGGLCEKFVSPGRVGVPDRLITWPGGEMHLVECKAPGKVPRASQIRDHARRKRLGVEVYLLDTKEKVDHYCRRGNP